MRPENAEMIKRSAFEHLAYNDDGKVMMSEIIRLFSDFGSPKELKQVFDELVRDGLAEPINEDLPKATYSLRLLRRWVMSC